MVDKCKLCRKELPEDADSLYCEECDEALDKKFDKIEEDILVYKDLSGEEIETLRHFDTEDILELYAQTYIKFFEDSEITKKEQKVLDKLKNVFNLKDKDVDTKIRLLKKMGKEICTECKKPIQNDFNLCPYCGFSLKEDFKPKEQNKAGQQPSPQDMLGPMFKSPGCLIIVGLIVVAVIVYLIYSLVG